MINHQLLSRAIESFRDGLIITEPNGNDDNIIIYANAAFKAMTGYDDADIIGKDCRFLQKNNESALEKESIRSSLSNNQSILITIKNYKKDGRAFWNELSISPIKNDAGEVTHHIGIQKDVTEAVVAKIKAKEKRDDLERMSYTDSLTNVYNRRAYDKRIKREIEYARISRKVLSLLMIDIDGFKQYNDIYGHERGDVALTSVAQKIASLLPNKETVVARLGGEEFAVILPSTDLETAQVLAQSMIDGVKDMNIEHTHSEFDRALTISIGVASTQHGVRGLMSRADQAMYLAKRNGRNRYQVDEGLNA